MDKITREIFETWAKGSNWLKINEVGTHNGPQISYITPSGEIVYALYNLTGELQQLIKPMPAPPQAKPVKGFPIDFRGGGPYPGLGGLPK